MIIAIIALNADKNNTASYSKLLLHPLARRQSFPPVSSAPGARRHVRSLLGEAGVLVREVGLLLPRFSGYFPRIRPRPCRDVQIVRHLHVDGVGGDLSVLTQLKIVQVVVAGARLGDLEQEGIFSYK